MPIMGHGGMIILGLTAVLNFPGEVKWTRRKDIFYLTAVYNRRQFRFHGRYRQLPFS
jgi:hypothetical protein